MRGQAWELWVPLKPMWLNDKYSHWAQKSEATRNMRQCGWALARQAKIVPCERVLVELFLIPPDNRRRDDEGLIATLKPLVDGLVDAKVVPDDCPEFMKREMPVIMPKQKVLTHPQRLLLRVTDVSGLDLYK